MCIPSNRRAVQAACSALLAAASLFAAITPPTAMAAVRLVGNINAGGNPEAGFDNIGSGKSVVLANRYHVFAADDSAFGEEPWVHDLISGVTRRLGDLNPGAGGSRPDDFMVAGGRVVFTATTPNEGEELWVTDGTPAGTQLLADINPGLPSSYVYGMAATTGNRVVFNANDGTHGTELWISDGTAAGTVLAHDLVPGASGSSPMSFTTIGARLFFRAFDAAHGSELWMWDAGGVGRVADIEPGSGGSNPSEMIVVGVNLVFRACRTSEGCELWRSDGSAAGTVLFADVRTGATGSDPLHLVWHAGLARVFFDADDGINGRELWQVDAAGSASRVSNLVAGSGGARFAGSIPLGARLLFVSDGGVSGARLYAWNGAALSQLVSLSTSGPGTVENLVAWNGRVYLSDYDCFYSDGTVAGTVAWDPDCVGYTPFAIGGGRLLYASYGDSEREMWSISTTDVIAKESEFTDFSSNPSGFVFRPSGSAFVADAGTTGTELVVEDAAANGFTMIDLLAGSTSSRPDDLTPWRSEIWFSATSATTGNDLWHTDGTLVGTTPLELVAGASGGYPEKLLPVDNQLYLVAEDASLGNQLFRLRGNGPTIDLLDYSGESNLRPEELTYANGKIFFIGNSITRGNELFVVDPTALAPTALEIVPGIESPDWLGDLVAWDDALWLVANVDTSVLGGSGEQQIYRSDGITVARVSELPQDANPRDLVAGPGGIWFIAEDTFGDQLWRTDGISTTRMTSIDGTSGNASIGAVTVVGIRLYFTAYDDDHGHELWMFDGAGVLRRADVRTGASSSLPQGLVASGESVVFSADDGIRGRELWIASATGVRLLAETWPGIGSGSPSEITADPYRDRVLYSAVAPIVWREPFEVDVPLFKDAFEGFQGVLLDAVP